MKNSESICKVYEDSGIFGCITWLKICTWSLSINFVCGLILWVLSLYVYYKNDMQAVQIIKAVPPFGALYFGLVGVIMFIWLLNETIQNYLDDEIADNVKRQIYILTILKFYVGISVIAISAYMAFDIPFKLIIA